VTRQHQDEEPHHRQWLHAMEAESTIPGTVMQVARIYADYAASRGGHSASVSYPVLIRQTHRSRDALAEAHEWMTAHGWLRLQPGKDGTPWREGQRKTYDLTFGRSGEKRKAVRPPERSGGQKQSGEQTGSGPKRSDDRNGSAEADQSDQQTATSPVAGTEPVRSPDRERLTSGTSSLSSPVGLHAALAAVVPNVTEREAEAVVQVLKDRGAKSPGAVLRTEIRDGTAGALVTEARRRLTLSLLRGDPRPAAVQFRDLCPRCSRLRHDPAPCPISEPAARPVAVIGGQPCHAGARCQQPQSPTDQDTGYHAQCALIAGARASMAARTVAQAKDGGEAA
jgi:hypothetical protein